MEVIFNFSLHGLDLGEPSGDRTAQDIAALSRDGVTSFHIHQAALRRASMLHAREQRAKRKGRRRLRPTEAWPVEARRARALCLEAVRVANNISPPTGDWRRHGEAARPYFHAMHVSVRLLCEGTCAWARARVLAHMAGDGEGLAYCTRGLHAAQAAPRPPTWCEDVGEAQMRASGPQG